jgi:hypothetical protein
LGVYGWKIVTERLKNRRMSGVPGVNEAEDNLTAGNARIIIKVVSIHRNHDHWGAGE